MPASGGEAPAPDLTAAARSSPFDRLPEALLSHILEVNGLQAAAAARAVCKRWRAAAEAVLWNRVDVSASSEAKLNRLERLLVKADGEGGRWIRVAPGASLRVQFKGASMGDQHYQGLVWSLYPSGCFQVAASLVAAFTSASGGLGDVVIRGLELGVPDFGGLLGALVPPGSSACPALRSFSHETSTPGSVAVFVAVVLPQLEPVLRPFPNLESLSLTCWVVDGPSADVIAQCLPRLKRVDIGYVHSGIAGNLAALPSLEVLRVNRTLRNQPQDTTLLLEGLASGPAARSLKELYVCDGPLSRADLRALPRLTALERFAARFTLDSSVGEDELAALGSCPALRSLDKIFLSPMDVAASASLAARLAGLAAALERSPSLADLVLALTRLPPEPALAAFERLARAARGRLSLRMTVDPASPHLAGAAAALVAAPLRRLSFSTVVSEAALEGGLLDRFSAFAGCAQDLQVNFGLAREFRSKPQESTHRDTERVTASLRGALGIPASCVRFMGIMPSAVARYSEVLGG
eukprot:tig00000076_g2321.t1